MESFKIGCVTAYNDDYTNILPLYKDKYFDLCYDDPEWGIGADKPTMKPSSVMQKNGKRLKIGQAINHDQNWDSKPPNDEYFEYIFSKSKNQIIWGVNFFDYPLSGGRIVWDKLNGNSDQFDGEIAYCSFHQRIDIIYYMWAGMFQGIYCGRDLNKALVQQGNKKLNEKRRHPTQKPIILDKYILQKYAKNDSKILVTHGGSLNAAIACLYLGLECVICEIDSIHFNNGVEELKYHDKLIKFNQRQQILQFT